jgi:hypothetical protein
MFGIICNDDMQETLFTRNDPVAQSRKPAGVMAPYLCFQIHHFWGDGACLREPHARPDKFHLCSKSKLFDKYYKVR